MLRTLHGKLSLILLLLLVPIGAFYVWSTVAISQRYVHEVIQKANVGLAEQLVAHYDLMVGRAVDARAFAPMIATLKMTNPTVETYVLDPGGRVIASSAAQRRPERHTVPLGPIRTFLQTSTAYPLPGESSRAAGETFRDVSHVEAFSAARIPAQGPLEGYLYIVLCNNLHSSALSMVRNNTVIRLGVGIVVAGLALTFLAGVLIFTLFTRRLKQLAAVMMRFQEGNFAVPASIPLPRTRYGDEVSDLTRVFNNMAGRMTEQVATLKEGDRLRRELIANVSHDLRTPLTTLQGYLETAQLPTFSEAEKQRYLEVATRQGVRLGTLVGELFELAKLEAGVAPIHPEPFPLPELLQDVVGEFRGVAEQRGVTLAADLTATPFVVADLGLIERVVRNLLDNALRHTPPGGTVTVTLSRVPGGVAVEVRDTGTGIALRELPHIFERYYRAPRTAGLEPTGAGLGLAISQRILELHRSRLHVSSRLGVGTAFRFVLATPFPNNEPRELL